MDRNSRHRRERAEGNDISGQESRPGRRDPLRSFNIVESVRACLGTTCFFLVTVLLCLDIATDVWVTVSYGLQGRLHLMGVSSLILALTSVVCAMVYIIQMKSSGTDKPCKIALCLILNVPFQLGIIGARLMHFSSLSEDRSTPGKNVNKKDWTFTKLKMIQGIFQSFPMMILNIYGLLYYGHGATFFHIAQYSSILTSFMSLTIAATMHEKVRKERLRNKYVGSLQTLCIFLYKSLIILARILAIANFCYFFQAWLTFVILPHFCLVFIYFVSIYHDVWRVGYQKMLMHSLFCSVAYFPVHNEYRPEGEIILYYGIFMIENIIMVSMPYGTKINPNLHPQYSPGSLYFKIITIIVLIGSAVGIILMAVYYFLLHKSSVSIRSTHFSWLERCCSCLHRPDEPVSGVQPSSDDRDNHRNQETEAVGGIRGTPDEENLLEESGPPIYKSPPPSYISCINSSTTHKSNISTDDDLSSDMKSPLSMSSVLDSDYKADISESDLEASRPPIL